MTKRIQNNPAIGFNISNYLLDRDQLCSQHQLLSDSFPKPFRFNFAGVYGVLNMQPFIITIFLDFILKSSSRINSSSSFVMLFKMCLAL